LFRFYDCFVEIFILFDINVRFCSTEEDEEEEEEDSKPPSSKKKKKSRDDDDYEDEVAINT
jgi:hypothetical protein